jgi:hypothetical protein
MINKKLSRRNFLHASAMMTGGIALATKPSSPNALTPTSIESVAMDSLRSFAPDQDWMVQALEPGLMEIRDKCIALDSRLQDLTSIHPSTGQIEIVDEGSIHDAFLEFVRDDARAQRASQWYLRLAEGGMMIPGPGASETEFVSLPWRALTQRTTLEHMPQGGWQALGIEPWLPVDLAAERLQTRFGNIPDYILQPERLRGFVAYAHREAWLETMRPRGIDTLALRIWHRNGGREIGIDEEDLGSEPSTATGPIQTVLEWVIKLGSEARDCLLNAEWRGDYAQILWQPILKSVTICMDAGCARKLRDALVSGATEPITAGLKAAKAGATFAGVISAAGGWVAVGIALGAAWWAFQISLALGGNPSTVCIVNYAPWWPHLVPMYAYGQ